MELKRARRRPAGPVPGSSHRARHWLRAVTGIGLAALATTWAAGPAVDAGQASPVPHGAARLTSVTRPAPQTPPAADIMTVDPAAVPASSTNDFTFGYVPHTVNGHHVSITLAVPPGWTAPVDAHSGPPGRPGYVSVACPGCSAKATISEHISGQTISVQGLVFTMSGNPNSQTGQTGQTGQTAEAAPDDSPRPAVIITYDKATAPTDPGPAQFTETAAPASDPPAGSPQVTVTCPDGSGRVGVSPGRVKVATARTLTFTYTAPGCQLVDGAVSLIVPPGWLSPSGVLGTPGYVTSSLGPGSVTVSGPAATVTGVNLTAGQQLTITYHQATAPPAATTSAFVASEQSAADGSLKVLSPPAQVEVRPVSTQGTGSSSASSSTTGSPTITVSSSGTTGPPTPVPSTGLMTVSPGSIVAGHPSVLTFAFQPPSTGLPAAGEVILTVPAGWTAPSVVPGTSGYTSASPGATTVSGRQIVVTGAALAAGQPLIISYHPATAPRAAGNSVFGVAERASTAAVLTTLPDPPSVAITGPSPFHIPATVGFILLAAACAAGLAAARFLQRRHPRPPSPPPPAVNTVPHAGPPGTVTVQPSRTEATHSMRIEPHPAAAVTTIEESRP